MNKSMEDKIREIFNNDVAEVFEQNRKMRKALELFADEKKWQEAEEYRFENYRVYLWNCTNKDIPSKIAQEALE